MTAMPRVEIRREQVAKPIDTGGDGSLQKQPKTASPDGKIGRNDPCPCGSGKKYKNCCGRNGAARPAGPVNSIDKVHAARNVLNNQNRK